MSEPTNEQRADWAKHALKSYAIAKGERPEDSDIVDLLADLMHVCAQDGRQFTHELRNAQMHFEAENNDTAAQPDYQTAIIIEGGLVQDIVTNNPDFLYEKVMVIDYDTEGADQSELSHVIAANGEKVQAFVRLARVEMPVIDLPATRNQLDAVAA